MIFNLRENYLGKVLPYINYFKMQPNALLNWANFYYCKKWVLQTCPVKWNLAHEIQKR
jgi:hypothetical protein